MNEIIAEQPKELREVIYRAPALISLYVAARLGEGHLASSEIKSVKQYASILSHQGPDDVQDYYKEVRKTIVNDIEELDQQLPDDKNERQKEIEKRLQPVKAFISKLPVETGEVFKDTLLSFIIHARNATEDTMVSFVLPFVMDELVKLEDERLQKLL